MASKKSPYESEWKTRKSRIDPRLDAASWPKRPGPPSATRRLVLDYASRDELLACLDHVLAAAGNPSLMTAELKATLVDHSAGKLDEKLFLEVFGQSPKPRPRKR